MRDPSALTVAGLHRRLGDSEVLHGVDLGVHPGEVMSLLGPSGCGKTTLLRCIAGLDSPEAGSIVVGGRTLTGSGVLVPPERRGVGMVFQNGALFPHLDVARNIGYGLARGERRRSSRIDEMLRLVGMEGFGPRPVSSLSGGQAQRIALARALAPSPDVLLLDEPFSNLDAHLRVRLRVEVRDLLHESGVTALFVTHDRDEAFTVGDRVAVMREGVIVQVGTPREVYERPDDLWTASFVGEVNLVPGTRRSGGRGAGSHRRGAGGERWSSVDTALGPIPTRSADPSAAAADRSGAITGTVVIRPEWLCLLDPVEGASSAPCGSVDTDAVVDAVVGAVQYLGATTHVGPVGGRNGGLGPLDGDRRDGHTR
ncbi:MAG: ABC transporter ATP-binding protein [Microthrixaceae bacterium]